MLVNHAHERLATLGLPGMAKAFDDQHRQPDAATLTFEVRLGLLDREVTERDNKRLIARLKFATLRQAAVIEDIDLRTPRGIERAFFAKLVDGSPPKPGDNKRQVDVREVMNGITYILSAGCQWRGDSEGRAAAEHGA
jgi:hypothetical protein